MFDSKVQNMFINSILTTPCQGTVAGLPQASGYMCEITWQQQKTKSIKTNSDGEEPEYYRRTRLLYKNPITIQT